MDVIIKDALFCQHSVVDVGPGQDRLVFERCTFMGGHVHVAAEIARKIFITCSFQGTAFTAQPLSPQIATDCHWQPATTEQSIPKSRLSM